MVCGHSWDGAVRVALARCVCMALTGGQGKGNHWRLVVLFWHSIDCAVSCCDTFWVCMAQAGAREGQGKALEGVGGMRHSLDGAVRGVLALCGCACHGLGPGQGKVKCWRVEVLFGHSMGSAMSCCSTASVCMAVWGQGKAG